MSEASIMTTLIQTAPGMAGIIIVVVLFLRAIEKRDQLFIDQLKQVTREITEVKTMVTSHDNWEREVVGDIQKSLKPIKAAK